MSDTIETLRRRMEMAAEAMDFEEARRLRDRIALLRGGASTDDAAADTTGIDRQQPGAMGLGSSRQRITPPADWTRPTPPDPMTTGRSRRRGR